jgi:hypothetical protein
MAKKIIALCKPHFNPIVVMLVGACVGIAVILPFIPGPAGESFLYRWQSMIGAFVSAALAVGLFQFQRHLDRRDRRKSLIFAAIRALKRIKMHYDNVKIEFAKSTCNRVEANRKGNRSGAFLLDDQEAVVQCIASIISLYGKYTEILSSIPRDLDLASDIIVDIDKIEESVELTSHALTILLTRISDIHNWGERNEQLVPVVIVNAQALLEDVRDQRAFINETLQNLQSKTP